MRRRAWLLLALAALTACRATPTPSPTATETPSPTLTASPSPPLPTPTTPPTAKPTPTASPSTLPTPTRPTSPLADPTPGTLDEVWVEPPPRPLPWADADREAPRRVPNARRAFWIAHGATGERRQITARLRVQTSHVAMWVEEGVWHDVRQLERAAKLFETDIYTTVHAAFGSEWSPGIDGDPRVSILHATGLGEGVLGYTSSLDEYPRDIYPQSNEAEMITLNIEELDVGSLRYRALIARELQRLIHWYQDRNEERWVREGLSELAATLVGSDAGELHQAYLEETDTPLTSWTGTDKHRGAAHLFMTYFHQRFGDEGTRALTAEAANGVRGFDAALEKMGTDLTFDDLFADWLASNVLDSFPNTDDARYAYPDLQLARPAVIGHGSYPIEIDEAVHQHGADYIVLEGEEDLHVQFTGQMQTPLFEKLSHTGSRVWWSNRADESLTSLTGRFDLRDLEEATLAYRVRYDIEPHYDYAIVEISVDGGQSWRILHTPSGTGKDPHGNNPGWGYTGASADWTREEVGLSDYVGNEALIRFSYLTDGAVTGEGLLLDAISVPEADAEGDETGRWTAHGFVLTDGWMRQDYLALVIRPGNEVPVERLVLEDDQSGDWAIPLGSKDLQDVVLILSAMTPRPAPPAPYQLTIHQ